LAVLKVSAGLAAGYLLARDENVHGAARTVVANNAVVGGFKRIGVAAQQAESALQQVDAMANHATTVMTEVSELIRFADPTLRELGTMLVTVNEEIAGLSSIRANADEMFARVDQIIGLIEFFLTPAFIARRKIEELAETINWIRSGLRKPNRQTPQRTTQHVAHLVPIAESRLAG
jgi:hypothetical protein